MSQSARSISRDLQSFNAGDTLEIRLNATGGLTKDANGLAIATDLQDGRGSLDPAGGGGTIVLPTAAGAETTVNNGTAYNFGDYYLVTSAGTVGTTHTLTANELPAFLVYNGGDATLDTGWDLIKGNADTSALVPNTRTVTGGDGVLVDGVSTAQDLTANRTLSVQVDNVTGGDVAPANVNANGVGVNVTALDGDHLSVDFTPANYTPDATPAEAADADDLAAHLKGIDDRLASSGYSHELYTTLAADVAARSITIPNDAVTSVTDCYLVAFGGAHFQHLDGVTFVAGAAGAATVSWAAGTSGDGSMGGELAAGDVLHIFTK